MTDAPENTTYDCSTDGHVFGPWAVRDPLPKPTRYRVCVIPGCHFVENSASPTA